MEKSYFNDAIIGNKNMTVTFSNKGELVRLFYPSTDYKQFFDFLHTGVKINDSALVYLHADINNIYSQEYINGTNILKTQILNTYFNLKILQTDFVPIRENILVKNYKFINESNIDLDINFLLYSKMLTNINNDTCGFIKNDCLIQYNHDYSVCLFAKEKLLAYQLNNSKNNIMDGVIGGKDYIGLSPDSSISYDIGKIPPGGEKEINIYILVNDNKERCLLNEIDNEIERIRKKDIKVEFEHTKQYWRRFLKEHKKIELRQKDEESKLNKIYERSVLLMDLFTNPTTGGISAGVEIDEQKTKCGRYSYCWPRDAVFVTEALDAIGMTKEAERFYKVFCKMTQSKNGMWEQRFYTDGRLAPSWGYQIDETASVVYGVYKHYEETKDAKFLKETFKMCENAIIFLQKYFKDITSDEPKMQKSYDLWEEYEGVSFYSISTIFAAYDAMLKILPIVKDEYEGNRLKIESIEKQRKALEKEILEIKEYLLNNFYDETTKSLIRNKEDRKIDISLLGAVTPFKIFSPKEKKIQNTIERINMTLRTFTGGYIRYENDTYMGGYNPWPISNLWMTNYYLLTGENKKALECFEFVINTCSDLYFLGEQVNNVTKRPAWMIGLTWSHAMFLSTLKKLAKNGLV